MATVLPMRTPMTATEMRDVLMTLTTGSGLIKSGQVEQISPLLQVSMIFSFEILSNSITPDYSLYVKFLLSCYLSMTRGH